MNLKNFLVQDMNYKNFAVFSLNPTLSVPFCITTFAKKISSQNSKLCQYRFLRMLYTNCESLIV